MNTIPNVLSLFRVMLVPIFVVVYLLPFKGSHFAAAMIFFIAAFTDWLDGYLARYLNQHSRFGAFIDPVADKLAVCAALVLVVGESDLPLLALPATVIVSREIIISGLREWMAEVGKRTSVAVTVVAKYKTLFQMSALVCLLWYRPGEHFWLGWLGYGLLVIAAVLTLSTMLAYLKAAWPELISENETNA